MTTFMRNYLMNGRSPSLRQGMSIYLKCTRAKLQNNVHVGGIYVPVHTLEEKVLRSLQFNQLIPNFETEKTIQASTSELR